MSDSVSDAEARVEAAIPEGDVPATVADLPAAETGAPGTEAAAGPEYDPAAPAPLNVPRTGTGHPDVDAALDRLSDADHLATDGHVEVYEDVHRELRDALTALDARPGPPAPPPARHPTTIPQRGPSGPTV
ncbi:hypothetical protein [Streptomyces ipomoeae]|uniref:hypothetical protein n=1 Tax=Streptomyces ipomoeae TaxID=103232 RepID=UPI00114696A2|nr:hypothetical protein [Streptomyces ipomoeae]MDX2936263.1 hypothetical protein [Streptomyces ipomoeae]TQE26277.1 hypothetical protein SipoB123_14625 [Streptomyces ipomoeae]